VTGVDVVVTAYIDTVAGTAKAARVSIATQAVHT
jgi:hypothetical protein